MDCRKISWFIKKKNDPLTLAEFTYNHVIPEKGCKIVEQKPYSNIMSMETYRGAKGYSAKDLALVIHLGLQAVHDLGGFQP